VAELGSISLLLALMLSSYSGIGSLLGVWKRAPHLIQSARYATYLAPLALCMSTVGLVGAFVTKDFQVEYVADHSNRAMDTQYIWVAFYAGNEGSLLFIAMSLSIMAALAVFFTPRALRPSLPYINVVLMAVLTFFVAVTAFLANPFSLLQITPPDGQGVNPLLTHFGMFIHPPMLMLGLISFTVPFAFAIGPLLSGRTGDEWVEAGRTWGLIAWVILGSGTLLGAWWAYTILGWGGYWAWDPIESVGLMPWLVATAFLHSIMVQRRRGMFRMWNLCLIIITFGLAQFGMFLNRGGPTVSVHSFGQSSLGWVFLAFMGGTMLFSFGLFFLRFRVLKSAQSLESALSREAAFLLNNLLFLSIAFATLWGVIYPLITDVLRDEIITVGTPFYNQVNGPLFLGLILLMGIAPFLPWRHASWATMRRALLVPTGVAVAVALLLLLFGVNTPYPVIAVSLCALVASGILREWIRGTLSRHRRGESYPVAFGRLIASNRPRYGGYIVHLAVVSLALGVVGSGFYDVQKDVALAPGESTDLGGYTITYNFRDVVKKSDRTEVTTTVQVYRGDNFLGTFKPWRAYYPSFNMSSTRAAIRTTPMEDLYIIAGEELDDGRVVFRLYVNPLMVWIWIAGPIVLLGFLVLLWPQRELAVGHAPRPLGGASASAGAITGRTP
jgi:cytochrome c-type biogenesis protein CcmF